MGKESNDNDDQPVAEDVNTPNEKDDAEEQSKGPCYCYVCEMWLNGWKQRAEHRIGKTHKKKEAQRALKASDTLSEKPGIEPACEGDIIVPQAGSAVEKLFEPGTGGNTEDVAHCEVCDKDYAQQHQGPLDACQNNTEAASADAKEPALPRSWQLEIPSRAQAAARRARSVAASCKNGRRKDVKEHTDDAWKDYKPLESRQQSRMRAAPPAPPPPPLPIDFPSSAAVPKSSTWEAMREPRVKAKASPKAKIEGEAEGFDEKLSELAVELLKLLQMYPEGLLLSQVKPHMQTKCNVTLKEISFGCSKLKEVFLMPPLDTLFPMEVIPDTNEIRIKTPSSKTIPRSWKRKLGGTDNARSEWKKV